MLLQVKNLKKTFRIHHLNKDIPAINNCNFQVEKGTFTGIVGPSGSGKSTIIKCIYRSYLPQSGQILYETKDQRIVDLAQISDREMIQLRKQEIGYVSQFLSIMPRTTALELVIQSIPQQDDQTSIVAKQALTTFGIDENLWDSYPNTFSGGEKLRLNIACAIVKQPRLLLLDEPTASLDHDSKLKVRAVIETLKQSGTTMIGIFHDLEFMQGLCDDIYYMQQGKQVQ